ncbi:MAG: hypothetical protein UZ21_OP11001001169 [Microgenomates bacterium OLB22]|nr:MAG: hypothetical protein UZ21_OP11001001169 [Microgenomates bacterium OLB22]
MYEKPSVQQLAHTLYNEAAQIDPRITILNQENGNQRKTREMLADEIIDTVLIIPQRSDQPGEVNSIKVASAVSVSNMRLAYLRERIAHFDEIEALMRETGVSPTGNNN